MSKKTITERERELFILACKKNDVIVSREPQKRMMTATIIVGGKPVSVSKNLTIKRGRSRKVVKNTKPIKS